MRTYNKIEVLSQLQTKKVNIPFRDCINCDYIQYYYTQPTNVYLYKTCKLKFNSCNIPPKHQVFVVRIY